MRRSDRGGAARTSFVRPSWTLCKISLRLALILMTCSLFVCKEVRSPEELGRVALGLPIPFVTLDASRQAPAEYPHCLGFGNPHADTMRLRPLAAVADLALLTLALMVAVRLVRPASGQGNPSGADGGGSGAADECPADAGKRGPKER